MLKVLIVGIGGFIGSILRYLLSGVSQNLFKAVTFPIGTLIVNILGCFVIGFLSILAEYRNAFNDFIRTMLFIGVLGGFTTFSSFSNETFNLFREGDTVLAIVNIFVQIAGGLLFVWFGRLTAYSIWR